MQAEATIYCGVWWVLFGDYSSFDHFPNIIICSHEGGGPLEGKVPRLPVVKKAMTNYPTSRGPSIFIDKSGRLPDLSRKIEGPLLAG